MNKLELQRIKREVKFKDKIKDTYGSDFELVGNYIDSNTDVEIKHLTCGHKWTRNPMSIRTGNKYKCPHCQSVFSEMTEERFLIKLHKLYNNDIEIISEYNGYDKDITIRRLPCGHEYTLQAKSLFRNKSTCKICNMNLQAKILPKLGRNKSPYDIDKIKELVNDKFGDSIKILSSEYKDHNTPLEVHHKDCDETFTTTYGNLISSKVGCPFCAGNRKYSTKAFMFKYGNKVDKNFEVFGDYPGSSGKMNVKHKKCNHVFKVTVNRIKNNDIKCPHCESLSDYKFKQDIFKKYGNEYDILSTFKSTQEKVYVRHNECGYKWWVKAQAIREGKRTCPLCSKNASRQERFMYRFLKLKEVNFEYQYSFKNEFRNNNYQSFDFFFPELKIALEIDGIQHYDDRYHRGNIDRQEQNKRDRDKNRYCLKHGIKIIRIFPYIFDTNLLSVFLRANKIIK